MLLSCLACCQDFYLISASPIHPSSCFSPNFFEFKNDVSITVNRNFACGSNQLCFALIWPWRLTGHKTSTNLTCLSIWVFTRIVHFWFLYYYYYYYYYYYVYVCVCACVRACVRACVCVYVCMYVGGQPDQISSSASNILFRGLHRPALPNNNMK